VYRGDVFQLVDQAVGFVASRINARVGERKKKAQFDVDYEIPLQAITEAIVNAVAHRDYTSNASVQVMLFKNRLEVWSPGTLPLGMTIERLKKPHSSVPVNPLLATPMYLSGYIDRAGTGTKDIIDRCESYGLKTPEFIQEEDFRVVLWRASEQSTDQPTDQAEKRVRKIVELLSIPRKRAELQALVGIRHNDTFRKNYLSAAIAEGYVTSSHPDNPTHPDQLYFLTEKGKAWLNKQP
jgi:predicted HTH transcriptional regulator